MVEPEQRAPVDNWLVEVASSKTRNYYGSLVPFRKIFGPDKKNAMKLPTFAFIQKSGAFTCPEMEQRRAEPEPD